jgi:anti-sigma-K factor RskA/putative zinc finger protein
MTDRLVAGLHCSEATDLAAGFVTGALAPGEMDRVRAHLATCPEAHAEFAELGSAVPALLADLPQAEPSAALRGRILAAARAERTAAATDTMVRATDTMARPTDTMARPVPIRPTERGGLVAFLAGARPAWAVAGIAAVLAVVLGLQTFDLQARLHQAATYNDEVAAVLQVAARPGSQLAVLAAGNGAAYPAGIAAVGTDGAVRLAIQGLTPTTGAQVYEAWVIAGTAAPVPIGGFAVGSSGAAALSASPATTASGIVVALTLEPGPGATTPTLPIIASGVAQAPPG